MYGEKPITNNEKVSITLNIKINLLYSYIHIFNVF
jgi:hypothetical protein